MSSTIKQMIKTEALIWIQYFLISLLAAIWAYDRYVGRISGAPAIGEDVNLFGFFRKMFYLYLEPWFVVFFLLTVSRLAIVLLINRSKSADADSPSADCRR